MNEIAVQLEADDYVSAQGLHCRWTRKAILALCAAVIVGALLLLIGGEYCVIIGAGLIGGAVGGGIAREFNRRFVLPRRSRRLFAQQKNLQRPLRFSWDEQGLAWVNESGSGRTAWSDYIKWRENERVFLLYLSDVMFQMLPKRAFADGERLRAFVDALGGIRTV
jgi:hypothetical protein